MGELLNHGPQVLIQVIVLYPIVCSSKRPTESIQVGENVREVRVTMLTVSPLSHVASQHLFQLLQVVWLSL